MSATLHCVAYLAQVENGDMMHMERPSTTPKQYNEVTIGGVKVKTTYVINLIHMFDISITFFRMVAERLHHELRKKF
eukprot:4414853-Amphidinium_carterae.1